jgi:hypothetical protein
MTAYLRSQRGVYTSLCLLNLKQKVRKSKVVVTKLHHYSMLYLYLEAMQGESQSFHCLTQRFSGFISFNTTKNPSFHPTQRNLNNCERTC